MATLTHIRETAIDHADRLRLVPQTELLDKYDPLLYKLNKQDNPTNTFGGWASTTEVANVVSWIKILSGAFLAPLATEIRVYALESNKSGGLYFFVHEAGSEVVIADNEADLISFQIGCSCCDVWGDE